MATRTASKGQPRPIDLSALKCFPLEEDNNPGALGVRFPDGQHLRVLFLGWASEPAVYVTCPNPYRDGGAYVVNGVPYEIHVGMIRTADDAWASPSWGHPLKNELVQSIRRTDWINTRNSSSAPTDAARDKIMQHCAAAAAAAVAYAERENLGGWRVARLDHAAREVNAINGEVDRLQREIDALLAQRETWDHIASLAGQATGPAMPPLPSGLTKLPERRRVLR